MDVPHWTQRGIAPEIYPPKNRNAGFIRQPAAKAHGCRLKSAFRGQWQGASDRLFGDLQTRPVPGLVRTENVCEYPRKLSVS
jgi:hypothetical protein